MKVNLQDLKKKRRRAPRISRAELEEKRQYVADTFAACGYQRINARLFDVLSEYAVKIATGSAQAGLVLIGSIGCGKTAGVEILAGMFPKKFDLIPAPEFPAAYDDRLKYEQMRAPRDFFGRHKHLIIDDIGTEPCPYITYGNEVNVIADVLTERYRLWERYGVLTIITTNLPKAALFKQYGDRIKSRLEQSSNIVAVNGNDLRRQFR